MFPRDGMGYAALLIAVLMATLAATTQLRLFGHVTGPRAADIHQVIGEPARVTRPVGTALTVVSWNIAYGTRFERILAVLRDLDADVYLLQEVDLFARRSGNRNVARDLAEALGANWVFAGEFEEIGESTGYVPALTGQAIISRQPIASIAALPFSAQAWARWHLNLIQPRRGGRMALVAQTSGILAYNVHLESGDHEGIRTRQLAEVLAHDAAIRGGRLPVVFAGDFNNARPTQSRLFFRLANARFTSALPPDRALRTSKHRGHPIDWIFFRGLRRTDAFVPASDGTSDHDPIVVTFATP